MTTFFVSRHAGAIEWITQEGLLPDSENVQIVADFDLKNVVAGDLVIGTLPAQLAAALCERGARYQHLTLDILPEQRGKELSADEMRACNARLEEFFIQRNTVTSKKSRQIAHLCLVSDQALQNLIPARLEGYKPDCVHLLQSVGMKSKNADSRLKYALEVAGIKNIDTIDDCPDHDLPQIIAWGARLIQRLRKEAPQTRFILNLTGGNKLMSMGLLQAMRPWCEAIYCDTGHKQLEILHPPGRPAIALLADLLTIKTYLAAQGFTVREEKTDGKALDDRRELTRWLVDNAANLTNFIGNLNAAAAYWEAESRTVQSPNLRPCSTNLEKEACQRLLDAGMLEKVGEVFKAVKGHAAYLRGGWLEEYCYAIGRELESSDTPTANRLSRKRHRINIKIDPIDRTHPSKYPLNELDAAFVHNNRMLIIECKTGAQLSGTEKSQTILNKLEMLGEHAAGRFSSKILLTTERNLDSATTERAKRYRIKVLTAPELRELKQHIINWMNG